MINDENCSFYLRYLVKITEENGITYDEFPEEFIKYFSIPGLAQALNIKIHNPPVPNISEVKNYMDSNTFNDFNSLVAGIKSKFQTNIDKLYAAYYYTTHTIEYDLEALDKEEGRNSIEKIFRVKKGVCANYTDFMVQLAKRSGVTSKYMRIHSFTNASKAAGWDDFNPPKKVNYDHGCVFVEIDGERFLSEPTWGAGGCYDSGEFSFDFKPANFLIPYYRGVLSHFPKNDRTFSYEHFIRLAKPNFNNEIAFESNPFQLIRVKNGTFNYQISLTKRSSLYISFYRLVDDTWKRMDSSSVTYRVKCLEKELPNRLFTAFPEFKRSRFMISILFHETGTWKLTFADCQTYFEVENSAEKRLVDYYVDTDRSVVVPITPLKTLSSVKTGFVRIRFAFWSDWSFDRVSLCKVFPGTFEKGESCETRKYYRFFAVELDENEDDQKRLLEGWLLVEFPEDGRFYLSFDFSRNNEKCEEVVYYFDVTGSGVHNEHPFFDLPKTRKFSPFKQEKGENLSVVPSSSVVILNVDSDFNFHVFGEKKLDVYFAEYGKYSDYIYPTFITIKETDKEGVFDHEYSTVFTKKGRFVLNLKGEESRGTQEYYVIDDELPEESFKDKKLIENMRKRLEREVPYDDDIPIEIRRNVDKMLRDKIQENEKKMKKKLKKQASNECDDDEEESEDDDSCEIDYLREKAECLEKEKEDLRIRFEEMERKEREMRKRFEKEIEKLQREWSNKDQEFVNKMKEKEEARKKENDEFAEQEKSKRKKRIDELTIRIQIIENTMKEGQDKKQKILSLQEEIVNEERDEFAILSSRQEKQEREQKQDEKLINEKINKKQEKVTKNTKRDANKNQEEEKSESQANSNEVKSKSCILI